MFLNKQHKGDRMITIAEIRTELPYVNELFQTGHFDELIKELSSKNVTFEELRSACEEFVGEKDTAYMEAIIRMMQTIVYVTIPKGVKIN